MLARLDGEVFSLAVAPGLGAKVVSLRSSRTGREWLVPPDDDAAYHNNQVGDNFATSMVAGADECIPTVAWTTWQGTKLADHGEAWSRPWSLDQAGLERGIIRTTLVMPVSPWRLQREITMSGADLVFSYTLTNLATEPSAFLWAWHPLFVLEPGDHIELPGDVGQVVMEVARKPDAAKGVVWNWPEPQPGVRLDAAQLATADDSYAKFFAGPLTEGRAVLHSPSRGESLTIAWNPAELPYAGVWISRGGWNGHQHLALEPTTAAGDMLDEKSARWVPVGVTVRWQFTLSLSSTKT